MRAGFFTASLILATAYLGAVAISPSVAEPAAGEFKPENVLAQILDSAEYRELLEDQFEDAEGLFAGHRACSERSMVTRVATDVRGAPEIDYDNGKLVSVDLFDSWKTTRCGRQLQHNFTLWVISRDGLLDLFGSDEQASSIAAADMLASFTHQDSITIVAFTIPGTTLASDEMVAEIIAGLTDDAELAHFETCDQELVIVDTEFADIVERIRRGKGGSIKSGKWGEFWTLYGCHKEVRYPVILTKAKETYDVDVFVNDVESLDFTPKATP